MPQQEQVQVREWALAFVIQGGQPVVVCRHPVRILRACGPGLKDPVAAEASHPALVSVLLLARLSLVLGEGRRVQPVHVARCQ
jgi:hypothetical protein